MTIMWSSLKKGKCKITVSGAKLNMRSEASGG